MEIEYFGHQESSNTAICIPSYNEDKGILSTLEAIALQEISNETQINVVIVVNAPQNSSPEIVESNQQTVDTVRQFASSLSGNPLFQDGRLAFTLISIFGENALEECNVGIARDIAAREALKILQSSKSEIDDCIIIGTDADSRLGETYVQGCRNFFLEHPDAFAATGPIDYVPKKIAQESFDPETNIRTFYVKEDVTEELRIIDSIISEFHSCLNSVISNYYLERYFKHALIDIMPGSNTAMRAALYESIGEIPHLAGAEDLSFSLKVLDLGHNIHWIDDMSLETDFRISHRTLRGHGLGFYVSDLHKYLGCLDSFPMDSLEASVLSEKIIRRTNKFLNNKNNRTREEWESIIDMLGISSHEDMDALWEHLNIAPKITNIKTNTFFVNELSEIIQKRFPQKPFDELLDDLIEHVGGHNACSEFLGKPLYRHVLQHPSVMKCVDEFDLEDYFSSVFGLTKFSEIKDEEMNTEVFLEKKIQYFFLLEKIRFIGTETNKQNIIVSELLSQGSFSEILCLILTDFQNEMMYFERFMQESYILEFQLRIMNQYILSSQSGEEHEVQCEKNIQMYHERFETAKSLCKSLSQRQEEMFHLISDPELQSFHSRISQIKIPNFYYLEQMEC